MYTYKSSSKNEIKFKTVIYLDSQICQFNHISATTNFVGKIPAKISSNKI